jgi:hypothetical protein
MNNPSVTMETPPPTSAIEELKIWFPFRYAKRTEFPFMNKFDALLNKLIRLNYDI